MASKRTLAAIGMAGFTALSSAIGMPLTLHQEGMELVPYYDSVGKLTWCGGETQIGYKEKFTYAECSALFKMRYGWYSMRTAQLYNDLGARYVTPAMHAAFTDMAYNAGLGAAQKIIARVNAGNPRGACNAILLYKYAGGQDCSKAGNRTCPGVWNRRVRMNELCIKGMA